MYAWSHGWCFFCGTDPIKQNFNSVIQSFYRRHNINFRPPMLLKEKNWKWACLEFSFPFVLTTARFCLQTATREFVLCETHLHLYIMVLLFPQSVSTTGSLPFSKQVIHKEGASASSFNSQYHFVLKSSGSCLRLLIPHLPVTSILSSIFS